MGDIPVPPATLDFLILSLKMQAEMHLGLLALPGVEEKPEVNLPIAQHFIDLLAVLSEKTKNNLSLDEKRLMENALTELRFRFVQVKQQPEQSKEQKPEIKSEPAEVTE